MSATPKENLQIMEAQLANTNVFELPRGDFRIEGSPKIKSNDRIIAHDGGSRLINTLVGPTISSVSDGLGYTNIEHIPYPLKKGSKVAWFIYDGYATGQGSQVQWSEVVSIKSQTEFETNPPKGKQHTAIFCCKNAWYMRSAISGSQFVLVTSPIEGLTVGMWVFITPGPTTANAAWGEHRQIVKIVNQAIYFNQPLHYDHLNSVIADINTISNVTLEGVELIAQPNGHPITWGSMFKGHVNLKLIDFKCNGATDIITCRDNLILNPNCGPIQYNSTDNSRLLGGNVVSFYAEEMVDNILVDGVTFGHSISNAVCGWFHVNRLTFNNCLILGAGALVNGWPAYAIVAYGEDHTFNNIRIDESIGGWCNFGGTNIRINGLITDGAVALGAGTKGGSLLQVKSPWIELLEVGIKEKPQDACVYFDVNLIGRNRGWNDQRWESPPTQLIQSRATQSVIQPKIEGYFKTHDRLMKALFGNKN